MKKIAAFVLRCFGWEVEPFIPPEKKYVLIVAPHTSNWDFVVGRLAFWTKLLPARFMIKKEFFRFPLGGLIRALGGLPVERGTGSGRMIDQAVKLLQESENMALIMTPEGTRRRNPHWKKGFYHIAMAAQVPIYVGYVDYERKYCHIVGKMPQTGDLAADSRYLIEIYRSVKARYPEKFALPDWAEKAQTQEAAAMSKQ